MRVKLDQRLVKKLLALPESGMGYQRVDLILADGRIVRDALVFNAEEADLPGVTGAVAVTDVRPASTTQK